MVRLALDHNANASSKWSVKRKYCGSESVHDNLNTLCSRAALNIKEGSVFKIYLTQQLKVHSRHRKCVNCALKNKQVAYFCKKKNQVQLWSSFPFQWMHGKIVAFGVMKTHEEQMHAQRCIVLCALQIDGYRELFVFNFVLN